MSAVLPGRTSVWVVDDSALDAERARRVLNGDYAVDVFHDGSAMLERLAGHRAPDVLVLDWVMPGVSGVEVCRFLRSEGSQAPQMAILLLTAQMQTDQIVEGLAAGANDYLVKPYADPELRARVGSLVRWNGLLERARKAEARVTELLGSAPDALFSVDDRGVITYVNPEAERVFDKQERQLIGRPVSDILPALSVDDLPDVDLTVRPLPDITVGDQIFSPTIRSLAGSQTGGITVGLRDVTERRRKELRRLDFYSMMAHDLRSPLGAMLMRLDLMLRGRRGVLSVDLIAELRKLEGSTRSLVALINDFLDLARMEDGGHRIERTRIDLPPLIAEVAEDFRPIIDSCQQMLSLPVIDAKDVAVLGDRRRLHQVLTNMVANANKFTPAGGTIHLELRLADRCWEVAVKDDGPGIAANVLPTLFQRYSRAPETRSVAGTGLGLLIVREIVEAHGGIVGVESQPGKGSRFWFRIPRAAPRAD